MSHLLQLIILIILVICCISKRLYDNCLQKQDPFLVKIIIKNSSNHLIQKYNIPMQYTFDQLQQLRYLNISIFPQMGNLTLTAEIWPQSWTMPLTQTTRNLTRYSKTKKSIGTSDSLHMDLGIASKIDQNSSQQLHFPLKFQLLILYTQEKISQPKQNSYSYYFGVKYIKTKNKICYVIPIDLSQFHIPYKTYKSISQLTPNTSHQILLSSSIYQFTFYKIFYSLGHLQLLKKQNLTNGIMGQLITQDSIDLLKQILFENNFYFLLLFFVLHFLQIFMQFFAFKNQIQVWKTIQKNAGLSIKTLYQNLICQIIICLYLYDKQANKLFFLMQIFQLLLTLWKISKAISVTFSQNNLFFVKFQYKQWYHRKVQSVDSEALHYTKYLIAVLYSLFMIYKLYPVAKSVSGYYEQGQTLPIPTPYQSYSWMLESSVMFIFVLGFVMMTPQLYINYKLKSVDHLPWKTLIYRFVSTIIDDIFVFLIDLPFLQRMFSFRDDVIFVIYIIQRRIYHVDKNRIALASGSINMNKFKPNSQQRNNQIKHD